MPHGYSGTPLAKKLGIKAGFSLLFYQRPDHYFDLFADWPAETVERSDIETEDTDFIHLFVQEFSELQSIFPRYMAALKKDGLLWISWPKGSSKISTDLKRDPIREYVLEQGLVDVKVAAVDADWSGLKFVYRKKDR